MNEEYNILPPKWPLKLLQLFLRGEYLEEIEGDMEEVFQDNIELYSLKKARRIYFWDVVKLVRPSLLRKSKIIEYLNSQIMFKNNLKISMRVFARNKVYTFINLLGMSTGLAIALLIILYTQFEMSYENYNPVADRVVRVTMDYLNGETVVDQDCETYGPLGPKMKQDIPEVEEFAHAYTLEDMVFRVNDDFIREKKVYAVDPSFFMMLHHPFVKGNGETAFLAPFEMVLTESMAMKMFNTTDVLGRTVWYPNAKTEFKVVGIVKDCPSTTHLKFNMLVSYKTMEEVNGDELKAWNSNNMFTYILLKENINYANFLGNLDQLNETLTKEDILPEENVIAQPIEDIHLYSHKSFEAEINGDAKTVFFVLGVAILVIIIAIVNYINLSTSKSLDRAKEVGIRKVNGSSLTQLRIQFFTEALLVNVFSAVIAVLFMIVALPYFIEIASLPYQFSFLANSFFWIVLIGIVLLSTLLAGIFPAFVLSAFQPITVLKGKFSNSSKGLVLRKTLIVIQFAITIFLLVQTFTANQQLQYMQEKELGIDIDHTIVVKSPHTDTLRKNFTSFKDDILTYPQFESIAVSSCVPGLPTSQMGTTTGINLKDAVKESYYNFYMTVADHEYIPTLKLELVAGKNFNEKENNENFVIVNEKTMQLWDINDPEQLIGKQTTFWGKERTIIGVLKNFHQITAKEDFLPMIFVPTTYFGDFATIRTNSEDYQENLAVIKKLYETHFPDSPFNYFFLNQEFDKQYKADVQFQQVFGILAGFAILIACLGLFGIVSFTVSKRTKEIGIRKALGASIPQIVRLLTKDFIYLILFSMLFALPITYFIIEGWLAGYAFRIGLNFWLFVLPSVTVLIVSFVTIILKTVGVSRLSPAISLKDE